MLFSYPNFAVYSSWERVLALNRPGQRENGRKMTSSGSLSMAVSELNTESWFPGSQHSAQPTRSPLHLSSVASQWVSSIAGTSLTELGSYCSLRLQLES